MLTEKKKLKQVRIIGSIVTGLLFCITLNAQEINKKILGKWEWIQTTGGFGGLTMTPKTEGYSNAYYFSDAKSMYEYRNQKCHNQFSYTLKQKHINGQEEQLIEMVLSNKKTKVETLFKVSFVNENEIVFKEPHPDGLEYHYSRKK
jgi:hypothetical protein